MRLWDGWMRTASLQIELEASQWLRARAMARAVLQQRPTSLLPATGELAGEVEASEGRALDRGGQREPQGSTGR